MEKLELIQTIIAAVIAAYEILARVLPSTKTWSIIGNILNVLKKLSDALDNKIK